MLNKKSIVLNGVDDRSKRAVLTLECDGEYTKGNIRLYNFGTEPNGIISLGLYQNGEVIKAGLTHSAGMVFSFGCQLAKIPQKFSCAVINFLDGEPKPILYGNSEGYIDKEEVFEEVISSLSRSKSVEEVENVLEAHGIDFDDELKMEIDDEIEKCMSGNMCNDCENCEYKKFYMESIKSLKIDEEEEKEENTVQETMAFYTDLKDQIDVLFKQNPNEDYLEKMIPNSRWVKVGLDGGDDYYVLGLIYENDKLLYICYGVPGVYQKNAPRQLSGYPVWFPLDEDKPHGFGYWLSYQDADSGESVKAIVV